MGRNVSQFNTNHNELITPHRRIYHSHCTAKSLKQKHLKIWWWNVTAEVCLLWLCTLCSSHQHLLSSKMWEYSKSSLKRRQPTDRAQDAASHHSLTAGIQLSQYAVKTTITTMMSCIQHCSFCVCLPCLLPVFSACPSLYHMANSWFWTMINLPDISVHYDVKREVGKSSLDETYRWKAWERKKWQGRLIWYIEWSETLWHPAR